MAETDIRFDSLPSRGATTSAHAGRRRISWMRKEINCRSRAHHVARVALAAVGFAGAGFAAGLRVPPALRAGAAPLALEE